MTVPAPETVTIAIPVHNGERFLAEAIRSTQRQTVAPTEVIVFDNASTDRSLAIAVAALGPSAVRPTRVNQGAAWNFTRAVRESTGEYFAWLAADDRLEPAFVEIALAALHSEPEAPACLPAIRFITSDGELAGEQRDSELGSRDAHVRLRSFLRRPRWTEVYCLYRREALLASPIFRSEFGPDVLLTWWFLLRGPLLVVDEPLIEYRVYPTKPMESVAALVDPAILPTHWTMLRMWHRLWREAGVADLDPTVRAVARRELLMALAGRHWLKHNVADAVRLLASVRVRFRNSWGTT